MSSPSLEAFRTESAEDFGSLSLFPEQASDKLPSFLTDEENSLGPFSMDQLYLANDSHTLANQVKTSSGRLDYSASDEDAVQSLLGLASHTVPGTPPAGHAMNLESVCDGIVALDDATASTTMADGISMLPATTGNDPNLHPLRQDQQHVAAAGATLAQNQSHATVGSVLPQVATASAVDAATSSLLQQQHQQQQQHSAAQTIDPTAGIKLLPQQPDAPMEAAAALHLQQQQQQQAAVNQTLASAQQEFEAGLKRALAGDPTLMDATMAAPSQQSQQANAMFACGGLPSQDTAMPLASATALPGLDQLTSPQAAVNRVSGAQAFGSTASLPTLPTGQSQQHPASIPHPLAQAATAVASNTHHGVTESSSSSQQEPQRRKRVADMSPDERDHVRRLGRLAARRCRALRRKRFKEMQRRYEVLGEVNLQLTGERERLSSVISQLKKEIVEKHRAGKLKVKLPKTKAVSKA